MKNIFPVVCFVFISVLALHLSAMATGTSVKHWNIGTPIVGYYCGPGHANPFTEENGKQLVAGGWNIVWCDESGLDLAQKLGLRVNLLIPADAFPLATPDDAQVLAKLDALIDRVKNHPAMYCYWIIDEPNTVRFPAIAKVVSHIRERDPAHMAWVNLLPTYARNDQLNTKGDTVTAYKEYLRQFVSEVHPEMLSYDHYHFQADGNDGNQYFLNLEIMRETALHTGVPFMNIIQACTWCKDMRVPNGDELRWLTYTSLAYGAQAIAHYVYYYPRDHRGMMMTHEWKPTPLYGAASTINREFVKIAYELQPLRSISAYHAGTIPWGAKALPADAPFKLEPAISNVNYSTKNPTRPVKGMLLGYFGKTASKPTHVLVVNLDYKRSATTTLAAQRPLEQFNTQTGKWVPVGGSRVKLNLLPGGGRLLRLQK